MIRAEHLVKRFGDLLALDGVSLEVRPGEILGFLGPNGAGKSTTIRILSGWLPPSAGRAAVNGHDLVVDSLAARRAVGYLPENFAAPHEMRVSEYLAYRAELKGARPRAARARAREVAAEFGLDARWRQPFGTLSKGFRQRVGLADALLADPPALLLDEPFSGLDPQQRQEFREALRVLAARGKAILFSSHVLPEVRDLATRLMVLHRGRCAAIGTLDELQSRLRSEAPLRVLARGEGAAERVVVLAAAHGYARERVEAATGAVLLRAGPAADRGALFRALAADGCAVEEFHSEAPDLEQLFLLLVREPAA